MSLRSRISGRWVYEAVSRNDEFTKPYRWFSMSYLHHKNSILTGIYIKSLSDLNLFSEPQKQHFNRNLNLFQSRLLFICFLGIESDYFSFKSNKLENI